MAGRKGNAAEAVSVTITISRQSFEALNQIAALGIYGRNAPEVAARFVDGAIQKMVPAPTITINLPSQSETKEEK